MDYMVIVGAPCGAVGGPCDDRGKDRWRTVILNLDRMSTYFDNCAPTWFHSCHTNKVDIALNASMRIVTGCLKSTPTLSLPIDSGIQPPDIWRIKHMLKLLKRVKADPRHLLHGTVCRSAQNCPLRLLRLSKIRSVSTQSQCLSAQDSPDPNTWARDAWHSRWQNHASTLQARFHHQPKEGPPGHDLHRHCWVGLNCFMATSAPWSTRWGTARPVSLATQIKLTRHHGHIVNFGELWEDHEMTMRGPW